MSIRMVVVFPAPLGPRKPNTSPGDTERSMWSTTVFFPKAFVRDSVTISGCLLAISIPIYPAPPRDSKRAS